MTTHYVFRHLPSNIFCTIRADWSRVGDPEYVLDDIEDVAKRPCKSGQHFEIIGCFSDEDYDDNWFTSVNGEQVSKLPDKWEYDLFKPSLDRAVPASRIENLKPIPEREIDRNDFKRKDLL